MIGTVRSRPWPPDSAPEEPIVEVDRGIEPIAERRRRRPRRRHREVVRELARLRRQYASLRRSFDKLDEKLDLIDPCLTTLEGFLGVSDAEATSPSGPRQRSAEARMKLQLLAKEGTSSLEWLRLADGSAAVRVAPGRQFILPVVLGELLRILAAPGGVSDDRLIGWKKPQEVAALLEKEIGRPLTKRALTQNIYRLRRALLDRGGVNPYYLQTAPGLGMRFALRQKIPQQRVLEQSQRSVGSAGADRTPMEED